MMTVYHLSDDLGAINFNPAHDVLVVDDTSMRDVSVQAGSYGAATGLWIFESNHQVFLKNVVIGQLSTHNLSTISTSRSSSTGMAKRVSRAIITAMSSSAATAT